MALHVIVGAGPIGTATARHLVDLGHEVRMVTRTGSGPDMVTRVAADAADAGRLAELAGRRRRALQLRQPAVPPLARAVAAPGRRHARGRASAPARSS